MNRGAGERRKTARQTALDLSNFVSCGALLNCSTALIRIAEWRSWSRNYSVADSARNVLQEMAAALA